jgi:hypothetical protein
MGDPGEVAVALNPPQRGHGHVARGSWAVRQGVGDHLVDIAGEDDGVAPSGGALPDVAADRRRVRDVPPPLGGELLHRDDKGLVHGGGGHDQ